MEKEGEGRGNSYMDIKRGNNNLSISSTVLISVAAFILGVLICWFFIPDFGNFLNEYSDGEKSSPTCGDGSFNDTCSLDKSYYCINKTLVKNPSLCGCPEFMEKEDGECASEYKKYPKRVNLKYVLRGEEKNISFVVYKGVVDYLNDKGKNVYYQKGEKISRRDLKLNSINDKIQRYYVLDLVKKIQNIAPDDKVDQARIAVSLVQNIPYGSSDETLEYSNGNEEKHSRPPYEVLYDNEGICGEKVELMALLLREIGYGTSFFYYPNENHEALGIKCPIEESFKSTGYCFVETTMPAIISDSELEYRGIGKLSDNVKTYLLSEGISLPKNIYEYKDVEKLQNIKDSDMFRESKYKELQEKYGLGREYRVD